MSEFQNDGFPFDREQAANFIEECTAQVWALLEAGGPESMQAVKLRWKDVERASRLMASFRTFNCLDRLTSIAQRWCDLGYWRQAKRTVLWTMVAANNQENEELKVRSFLLLSSCECKGRHFRSATSVSKRALEIARENRDWSGQVSALRGLALAHSELGECSAALSVLQDALNVALASGEDYLHIPVLRSIGAIYNGQGRWKEAFEIFESLLITESALKDRSLRLELLTESGYSLRRLGRRNEAIQVFIEAIDLATTLGDRHSEGTAIYGLSMVYADQGHLAAALGGLSQDLAIAREFRDRSGEATSLNAIGTLYHRQKRWDESEACLLDSLELRERLGQIAMQGMTRSNLAVLYKDQGMYQKALESAEAAVRLLSETEDARRLRRAKDLIFEIKTELASHSDQSLDAQE